MDAVSRFVLSTRHTSPSQRGDPHHSDLEKKKTCCFQFIYATVVGSAFTLFTPCLALLVSTGNFHRGIFDDTGSLYEIH